MMCIRTYVGLLCASMFLHFAGGLRATPVLEDGAVRLVFASERQGGGLSRIEDVVHGASFLQAWSDNPRLWEVQLCRVGFDKEALRFNNRAAGRCRMKVRSSRALDIHYSDFPFAGDGNSLTVTLEVRLTERGRSEWRMKTELQSRDYTLLSTVFPALDQAYDPGADTVLFPGGNCGHRLRKNPILAKYPSYQSQLQFWGILRRDCALYLGLHDPAASAKVFELTDSFGLSVLNWAENISVAGKSRAVSYPVVISLARDAWDCCRLYRNWAEKQVWTRRGKRCERKSKPPHAEDVALWLNLDGNPESIGPAAIKEAEEHGCRLAVHWYCWMVHPFDHHYPEFFPAKPGFVAMVKAMRDRGMIVAPYLNGRLWDTALPSFKAVVPEACTRVNGTPIIENYGSGTTLGAMCPTSPSYGKMLRDTVTCLVEECGVNGIYIDQTASEGPVFCYNSKHGHPLGGGGWWPQAYRKMLEPLVNKYQDKVLFYTEGAAEPYIDTFDTFLTWNQVFTDDFPSLNAVYNQYAWYMCSLTLPEDDRNSFVGLMSRCLLWNVQPGWLRWLHGADVSKVQDAQYKRAYIKRLLAVRALGRSVIADGVPVGDLRLEGEHSMVTMRYHRNTNYGRKPVTPGTIRSNCGVIWKSYDGQRLMVTVAELSGKSARCSFSLKDSKFDYDFTGKSIYRVGADGKLERLGGAQDTVSMVLDGHDLQLYLVK